jgi:hypothetical protein
MKVDEIIAYADRLSDRIRSRSTGRNADDFSGNKKLQAGTRAIERLRGNMKLTVIGGGVSDPYF